MYDKLVAELTAMNGNAKALLEKYDNAGVKLDTKTNELLTAIANAGTNGLNAIQELLDGGNVENANNLNNIELFWSGEWDVDRAGTVNWAEVSNKAIPKGTYIVQLIGRTRATKNPGGSGADFDYDDPDGGEVKVEVDNHTVINNLIKMEETINGWGGVRNTGALLTFIKVTSDSTIRVSGRTPDGDAGGIKLRIGISILRVGN